MNLRNTRHADVVVVDVDGRIDHQNAAAFSAALEPHLAGCKAGGHPLLLNLSGLEYISSAGLRVFMMSSKRAAAAGGRIALANPTPMVREILAISRMSMVLQVHDSQQAALEFLAKAAGAAPSGRAS